MSTILKAVDIKKAYSIDHRQQEVLKGIHLEIQKGDFTVIMGSSGAGKSTLLYALSGMDYISSGKSFSWEEIETSLRIKWQFFGENTADLYFSKIICWTV